MTFYNYAYRPESEVWFYEGYKSEEEIHNKRAAHERHELERTASFATRMMNRFPSGAAGATFIVRVAEADLELDKDADATRLARRALATGAKGDVRAEALWVAGVSEFRRHEYSSARQALTMLIAENQNDRYTEGGRRQLAMLDEDTGNFEGALDQYLALDYRYDLAYFVDVLMTPQQLAAFIEKRPTMTHRDEMLYALGIRYLRKRRWSDARSTFAKVKTIRADADESYLSKINAEPWRYDRRNETPKEREFDSSIRGVRPQWIAQDMRTANELERLEREVEAGTTEETKAEALYQVASYQFQRSLLFYNPIWWHGLRHYLLDDLDKRERSDSQTKLRCYSITCRSTIWRQTRCRSSWKWCVVFQTLAQRETRSLRQPYVTSGCMSTTTTGEMFTRTADRQVPEWLPIATCEPPIPDTNSLAALFGGNPPPEP